MPQSLDKKKKFLYTCILLTLCILCQSTATAFSKLAGMTTASINPLDWITNKWYIASILCLFSQSVLWIKVLKLSKLHIAYQLTSMTVVLNFCYASFLFKEVIRFNHLIGLCFIIIGIALTIPKENESFL